MGFEGTGIGGYQVEKLRSTLCAWRRLGRACGRLGWRLRDRWGFSCSLLTGVLFDTHLQPHWHRCLQDPSRNIAHLRDAGAARRAGWRCWCWQIAANTHDEMVAIGEDG